MAKAVAKKKPMSKTELIGRIADETDLTKRDVSAVLSSLPSWSGFPAKIPKRP